jgi:hypothetical protein
VQILATCTLRFRTTRRKSAATGSRQSNHDFCWGYVTAGLTPAVDMSAGARGSAVAGGTGAVGHACGRRPSQPALSSRQERSRVKDLAGCLALLR